MSDNLTSADGDARIEMEGRLFQLVLRAPAEPMWTFSVAMPTERPEPVFYNERGERCAAHQSRMENAENYKEVNAWDDLYKMQRLAQWPWEYARAVLQAGVDLNRVFASAWSAEAAAITRGAAKAVLDGKTGRTQRQDETRPCEAARRD